MPWTFYDVEQDPNKAQLPKDFSFILKGVTSPILWPDETDTAKEIYAALETYNYLQLCAIPKQDARPYFLQLLKGIGDQSINQMLFETLHKLRELDVAFAGKLKITTLEQMSALLKLNPEQLNAMQKQLAGVDYPVERQVVQVFVPESLVLCAMRNFLVDITNHLNSTALSQVYRLIIQNKDLLSKVKNLKSMPQEAKKVFLKFNECLLFWEELAGPLYNSHGKWVSPFSYRGENAKYAIDINDISTNVSLYLSGDLNKMNLLTAVMRADADPLLSYHYDASEKAWFFIFLPNQVLNHYNDIQGYAKIESMRTFSTLTTRELVAQRLQNRRDGNIVLYSEDLVSGKDDFVSGKVDGVMPTAAFEINKHDDLHVQNLRRIPLEINQMIKYWLLLLGKVTGTDMNKAIWELADAVLHRFNAPLQSQDHLLHNFILDYFGPPDGIQLSIERCLLLTDLIVRDKIPSDSVFPWFIKLGKKTQNGPGAKIQQILPQLDKNPHRLLIASIVFCVIFNNPKDGNKVAEEFSKRAILGFHSKWELIKESGANKNMMKLSVSFNGQDYIDVQEMIKSEFSFKPSASSNKTIINSKDKATSSTNSKQVETSTKTTSSMVKPNSQ